MQSSLLLLCHRSLNLGSQYILNPLSVRPPFVRPSILRLSIYPLFIRPPFVRLSSTCLYVLRLSVRPPFDHLSSVWSSVLPPFVRMSAPCSSLRSPFNQPSSVCLFVLRWSVRPINSLLAQKGLFIAAKDQSPLHELERSPPLTSKSRMAEMFSLSN